MKRFVILFAFTFILIACKKKENPSPEETMAPAPTSSSAYTIKDYFPLKYGNYWVYECTRTDTNNVVQATWIDSCFVHDSTFSNGRWYYGLTNHPINSFYFTDSANCILKPGGSLELTLVNNDTLRKDSANYSTSWCKWTYIMKTTPTTFVYNSNSYFNCISSYCYFRSFNLNPNCNDWVIYNTYAPGVGSVYSKYGWINSCDIWEAKLVRCKIN
jgi:hypothetical protein